MPNTARNATKLPATNVTYKISHVGSPEAALLGIERIGSYLVPSGVPPSLCGACHLNAGKKGVGPSRRAAQCSNDRECHKGRCGAAPGRRRQNRLMTATPMLNAAALAANHACFRHQPSFLASRRLRRISCANAFLRGLNSLGSGLLRSSIDHPSPAVRVRPPTPSYRLLAAIYPTVNELTWF